MPDITMCANGDKCSKRESCYRYNAKPDRWQSYSNFYNKYEPCEYYWKIKKGGEK